MLCSRHWQLLTSWWPKKLPMTTNQLQYILFHNSAKMVICYGIILWMRPAIERHHIVGTYKKWSLYVSPKYSVGWNYLCIPKLQWLHFLKGALKSIRHHHWGTPIAHPHRQAMGCLLRRQSLANIVACLSSCFINGLVQECSNSIANALELLQSSTKPSISIVILYWNAI